MRADYNTHVTLVFASSARACEGNPLDIETPYGTPQSVAVGDALAELDVYRDALQAIADGEIGPRRIAEEALSEGSR